MVLLEEAFISLFSRTINSDDKCYNVVWSWHEVYWKKLLSIVFCSGKYIYTEIGIAYSPDKECYWL